MKIHGFIVVLLVLTPVCLASPSVGEFFEKLFGVFKPEGIVVTDAPDNTTESASNDTVVVLETKTVISGLDNDTEVISAKLTSVVVEKLNEEVTTESTTEEDTTSGSTPTTTTTVVYKLFHPNTTTTVSSTTSSSAETTETSEHPVTELTVEITTSSTKTAESSTATTETASTTENTTQHLPESTVDSTASSASLAPSLASSTVVDNVLCKTTYNAAAKLKITSCEDSATPKTHRKKRGTDETVDPEEPLPVADTIQRSGTPEESYPPSSEIGDDDGDDFPTDDNSQEDVTVPIDTY